jgi:hypothetical protein
MTANRLFTGLSPDFGDGLDNSYWLRLNLTCDRESPLLALFVQHLVKLGENNRPCFSVPLLRRRIGKPIVRQVQPRSVLVWRERNSNYRLCTSSAGGRKPGELN